MIKLQVNGEEHTLDTKTSIGELLVQLNLRQKRIAIELNQEIIPRSEHDSTQLKEGDKLEIIHAIGGG